jgi:NADH-quinone oxidoreductase subunit L
MVTAGVYMIGRNAVLFSHAPTTLAVVAAIGTATALMAGTIGLVQNDIKRVLAYSTVSQLGYMFLAMGVSAFAAGIFHLYTHAFFKALLFLGSGAVIHALSGEQDLRNMGGLKKALPITYWTFLIGAIAIAGVPPLAGFFSKDEILFRTFSSSHLLLWGIGLVTSFLTAVYMFRLVFLTFHGERRSTSAARHDAAPEHPEEEERAAHGHNGHLHDAPPAMALALIILAVGSVLAGFVGVPHALGGSNEIEAFLEPSFEAHRTVAGEFGAPGTATLQVGGTEAAPERHETAETSTSTELMLMALSSGIAIAGIGLAAYFWLGAKSRRAAPAGGIQRLLLNKYYVDEIYDAVIVHPIKQMSVGLWKGFDAAVIDGAVNGVGEVVRGSSGVLRRLQTGSVRAYAASLFVGVVVILGWYLSR